MGESIREEWVAQAAAGKSFADVGGLWGTVNEQVTVAARAGATATTMIDMVPMEPGDRKDDLWRAFQERAGSLGVSDTTCVQGNIDDPDLVRRIGSFDVVSCGGVIYHCPEPLKTLRNLRAITRDTLVLGTATIPETIANSAGTVSVEPGSALLAPALTQTQRAVLAEWLREVVTAPAFGVTHPPHNDWALDDYGSWWWLFTRDHVAALLRVSGFEVEALANEWGGRATIYLAKAVGSLPEPR